MANFQAHFMTKAGPYCREPLTAAQTIEDATRDVRMMFRTAHRDITYAVIEDWDDVMCKRIRIEREDGR